MVNKDNSTPNHLTDEMLGLLFITLPHHSHCQCGFTRYLLTYLYFIFPMRPPTGCAIFAHTAKANDRE